MPSTDRARAIAVFAVLGAIGAAVAVRLLELTAFGVAEARAAVREQALRVERLPARRGIIVDRHGVVLAHDRRVVEVRAQIEVVLDDPARPGLPEGVAEEVAGLLGDALATDAAAFRDDPATLRRRITDRLRAARGARDRVHLRARPGRPAVMRRVVDFLVHPAVDSRAALAVLRALHGRSWEAGTLPAGTGPARSGATPASGGRRMLFLDLQERFERSYPAGPYTDGVVGFLGEAVTPSGDGIAVRRGMEAFDGLYPDPDADDGFRQVLVDTRPRRYWLDVWRPAALPPRLRTTLDVELQKAAVGELERAAAAIADRYGAPPEWGAIVLVEIASGDVLAMASYHPVLGPRVAPFAPLQCVYQPGSVLKPLVFARALDTGRLDWRADRFDCTPDRPNLGRRFVFPFGRDRQSSRVVHDSHRCGVLDAFGVLTNSSNIGTVQIGQRLTAQDFRAILGDYGLCTRTDLALPGELAGTPPAEEFWRREPYLSRDVKTSLSIGYQLDVTPVQIARAYLRLLSGRRCSLRLYASIDVDGRTLALPPAGTGEAPFVSAGTRDLLRNGMNAVVADVDGHTGRHVARLLAGLGLSADEIGGKSGTSEYLSTLVRPGGERARVFVRNATFVAFSPTDTPRYLAVCVVQKEGARAFYGGLYAGPPAARLLLRARGLPAETVAAHGERVGEPRSVRSAASPRDDLVPWTNPRGRNE